MPIPATRATPSARTTLGRHERARHRVRDRADHDVELDLRVLRAQFAVLLREPAVIGTHTRFSNRRSKGI
jgi:hypothetical protein